MVFTWFVIRIWRPNHPLTSMKKRECSMAQTSDTRSGYSSDSGTSDISMSAVTPAEDARSVMINQVSWGAIFAGAVIAVSAQVVLNMVGVGVGAGVAVGVAVRVAGGDAAASVTAVQAARATAPTPSPAIPRMPRRETRVRRSNPAP